MTRKLRLPGFFLLAMLVHIFAWAVDEPPVSPAAASAPAVTPALSAAEQKTVDPAQPQKAPPAVALQLKPASAPVVPFKPASAPAAIARPALKPVTPPKPASAPVSAAPAKPMQAPAPSVHAAPAPAKPTPVDPVDIASQTVDIEVFVREGCLNCESAHEFLGKLKKLKPHIRINIRDVRKEPAALELLRRMAQNQNIAELDYPAFIVGGHLIIGFTEDENTARQILDYLPVSPSAVLQGGNSSHPCVTGNEPDCGLIVPAPVDKPQSIIIEIFGHSVALSHIGIPLYTITMGLLDGLNYGSTWVLILMISLLAPLKDRTLMLSIAGTFIAVQGLIYFALMAAWFNLIQLVELSRISQIVFSSIAVITAVIYFKNYLYFGHNISFASHEIAKPGIYTRIRKIVQAETLITALLATVLLAILVQISEFSYTSVFPALYTHVLALQKFNTLSNYGYLILYDFAYMLDDLLVLAIGVFSLSRGRQQEMNGRMLKLISSLALLGTAAYLLLLRY
ncbi:MAG: hypothetical protein WC236_04000 [Gallionellaceae bacterium]